MRRLSEESLRIAINLEQRYSAWLDITRERESMPTSMFFTKKGTSEYLTVKNGDRSTTIGARSPETEKTLAEYTGRRDLLDQSLRDIGAAMGEIIAQYKALRLPTLPTKIAKILRELDIAGNLGVELVVVGTNAFPAYELACGIRMPEDPTEDFDLAWCRTEGVADGSPLMRTLKKADSSFRINKSKPYQALDSMGYEVEMLVAPSLFKTLSKSEVFSSMAVFPEQEWLLLGRQIRSVVVSSDGKPCPLVVPDPRYMALLKIWLSKKPERNPLKVAKDRRQGESLLLATANSLQSSHPIDIDFVLGLPEELMPVFNEWAASNAFIPAAGYDMR